MKFCPSPSINIGPVPNPEIERIDLIPERSQAVLADVTKLLVIANTSSDSELRDLAKKAVSFFLNPPMMVKSQD